MSDTARAGEAQVARDDQPRGYGEGQQRQRHPKNQPKGCSTGPRHQQHKQRRRSRPREPRPPQLPRPGPPRVAPEQQVAAASTGDTARAEEAQAAPRKSQPGTGQDPDRGPAQTRKVATAPGTASTAAAAGRPRATRSCSRPGQRGWGRRERGTSSE
jgi:hypothetical protein